MCSGSYWDIQSFAVINLVFSPSVHNNFNCRIYRKPLFRSVDSERKSSNAIVPGDIVCSLICRLPTLGTKLCSVNDLVSTLITKHFALSPLKKVYFAVSEFFGQFC